MACPNASPQRKLLSIPVILILRRAFQETIFGGFLSQRSQAKLFIRGASR